MSQAPMMDITSDDKLWAALSYPSFSLAGIIVLLFMEDRKKRPFVKFHAVQSIVFSIALLALYMIVTTVTIGFGALCFPLFWLVTLWPAYKAYQGEYLNLPIITDFIKKQGWVN